MRRRKIDPVAEECALAWLAGAVTSSDLLAITDGNRIVRLPARCRVLDAVDHALRHGAGVAACAEFLGVYSDALSRWRRERHRFVDKMSCFV